MPDALTYDPPSTYADAITYDGQPLCGLSGDDYAKVLADLLPRGLAWPRDPAAVIMLVMRGLAEEFARVNARDCDLLAESYPCGASETLSDWERVAGLPDPCTGPLPTVQQRRAAVCAKLGAIGGASEAYFIELAATLGYQITIQTFEPFRASKNRAGDPVYGQNWVYAWRITVQSPVTFVHFRAGRSAAGEPLRTWGNKMLECAFMANKPAHTVLFLAYRINSAIWDGGASIWDVGQSIWDEGVVITP
jgi:uncharacterized protein YmfQ (DUF2313 family)